MSNNYTLGNQTSRSASVHSQEIKYPVSYRQRQKGQLIVKQMQEAISKLRRQNDQLKYKMAKIDLQHTNCINQIHQKYAQKQKKRKQQMKAMKSRKQTEISLAPEMQEEYKDIQQLIDRIRENINSEADGSHQFGLNMIHNRSRSSSKERSHSKQRGRNKSTGGVNQKSFNLTNSIKGSSSPFKEIACENYQTKIIKKYYSFQTVKKIIVSYDNQKTQIQQNHNEQIHLLKKSYDDQIRQLVSASRLNQQQLMREHELKNKDYLKYIESLKQQYAQNILRMKERQESFRKQIRLQTAQQIKQSLSQQKYAQICELERLVKSQKNTNQVRLRKITEHEEQILSLNNKINDLNQIIQRKDDEIKQKDQSKRQQAQQFQKYKKEITERVVKKIKKQTQVSQEKIKQLEQKYQIQLRKCQQQIKLLKKAHRDAQNLRKNINFKQQQQWRNQFIQKQLIMRQQISQTSSIKQKELRDTRAIYEKKIGQMNKRIKELQRQYYEKNTFEMQLMKNNKQQNRKYEEQFKRELDLQIKKRQRLQAEIKKLRDRNIQLTNQGKTEMKDIEVLVQKMKEQIDFHQKEVDRLSGQLKQTKQFLEQERKRSASLQNDIQEKIAAICQIKSMRTIKQAQEKGQSRFQNEEALERVQQLMKQKIADLQKKSGTQKKYLNEKINMLQRQLLQKQKQIQKQRSDFENTFKDVFKVQISSKELFSHSPSKQIHNDGSQKRQNQQNKQQNKSKQVLLACQSRYKQDKLCEEMTNLRIKELQTNLKSCLQKIRALQQTNTVLRRQICNSLQKSNKQKELYETVNYLRSKLVSSQKRQKLIRQNSLSLGKNRSGSLTKDQQAKLKNSRAKIRVNKSLKQRNKNSDFQQLVNKISDKMGPKNSGDMATVKAQRSYFKGVQRFTSQFQSPEKEAESTHFKKQVF